MKHRPAESRDSHSFFGDKQVKSEPFLELFIWAVLINNDGYELSDSRFSASCSYSLAMFLALFPSSTAVSPDQARDGLPGFVQSPLIGGDHIEGAHAHLLPLLFIL